MKIKIYDDDFSIIQIDNINNIDLNQEFVFYSRTDEENSVVIKTRNVPTNTIKRDDGWHLLKIDGVLDFSLIGILSRIATILSKEGISIFAISTYNTDYILIKKENLDKCKKALISNGYELV